MNLKDEVLNPREINYAAQLVRYSPERVAHSLAVSLDELRALCITWLSAERVLCMACMDESLFPGEEIADGEAVSARYQQVREEIATGIEQAPVWKVLASLYRYAVQGDASEISKIMQRPEQAYWHYKLGFVLSTLSRVQADWNETQPYMDVEDAAISDFHTAPALLLVLRFLARLKLDFPAMQDATLIEETSSHFGLPHQGLCLAELAVLSGSSYSRIKSLTASHNRERSGLHTCHAAQGVHVSAASAAQWLRLEPGFLPSYAVVQPEGLPEAKDKLVLMTEGRRLDIDEKDLQQHANRLPAHGYATNFCLIDWDGNYLFAVRMKKRGETDSLFRISAGGAGGNRLEHSTDIAGQDELKRLVLQEDIAVRATTLDGKKKGLYKLSGRSIMAAYDFDKNEVVRGKNK